MKEQIIDKLVQYIDQSKDFILDQAPEARADIENWREENREHRDEFRHFRNMMADESKEFHGKLERQDAEFKAFLMNSNKK